MSGLNRFAATLLFALALPILGLVRLGAETIPGVPPQPVVDAAKVIPADREVALNRRLADFERETSNQIVVAVYPHMDSESSIEDYTVRVAQSWGVGQKSKDNGAVLFVFTEDRKMYIQVGYGLEGALPDAICHQIIENRLKPAFRRGDFAGGIDAAIGDMIAATKGEYKGTGRTVGDKAGGRGDRTSSFLSVLFIFIMMGLFWGRSLFLGGVVYTGSGYGRGGWGGGGGFSGGGGGGFSGGGGSFGGGGSGGSW